VKVKIKLDPDLDREQAEISIREMTPAIRRAIQILQDGEKADKLQVMQGERAFLLGLDEIVYVLAGGDRCKVFTEEDEYDYKDTLKSFEYLSDDRTFIRISKSCVLNLDWIHYYEASFSGSLTVVFKNGHKEYVSRKYTRALKDRVLNRK